MSHRIETLAIHADGDVTDDKTVAPAIHYSAVFKAEDSQEFIEISSVPQHPRNYTRYGNPVHERVKRIVAELEGTETALVTASGMGAIATTILALVKAGDHVIGQTRHYMSTFKLLDDMLRRFGVEVTLVDQIDTDAFEAAIRPNTRLIVLESPVNPLLILTDIEAVARIARAHGILTLADNTFSSPINQRPHALGVDIVVHSATKYLGGHHDMTGGVICTNTALAEEIWHTHITLGSVLSPMDAWLLLRGLRTLPMRVERINANALELAAFLETQPQIERVLYPGLPSHPQHDLARRQMTGFGGVLAFGICGGYQAAERFVSLLQIPANAGNLGGVDSLVIHTAAMWAGTMTEAQMAAADIPPNFIRYSVGIEHVEDLKADIRQALQQL
jgi:cystathionine beta-lyase/cystathionine gamma-synthase